jgi:hypothetical protein
MATIQALAQATGYLCWICLAFLAVLICLDRT